MVDPPELMARTIVGSRSVDRSNDGESWNRHGATASTCDKWNARGCGRLCIHRGHFQSPRIPSARNRMKNKNARQGEASLQREVAPEPRCGGGLRHPRTDPLSKKVTARGGNSGED